MIVLDGVNLGDVDELIINDLLSSMSQGALFISDVASVDDDLIISILDELP